MLTYNQHKKRQKILKNVVVACQYLLKSDQAAYARKYLNSRICKDDQLLWKFGYFPTDDNLKDLIFMVSKSDLEYIKIYYPKFIDGGSSPHGHFSDHNLVMPFYNVHGEIISLVGRSLLDDEERKDKLLNKYNYSPGCRKDLFVYGLDKAKDSIIKKNCVILTEGQFDCIALHSNGITNAVALGWANLSRYQMFQIYRYTDNIVVMLDNDEAGQKGKIKIKNKYGDIANIKFISPPKGFKDIDEFFRKCTNIQEIQYVIDILSNIGD